MPDLIVRSEMPFNAEPPLGRLRANYITPQQNFYVRSHAAVPMLSEDTHRLRVGGQVATPLDLSMRDLRDGFASRTVVAVMQCAGNRRADLNRVRPVAGDLWEAGAIGNAAWTGVPLADVLKAAGAPCDPNLHVAFEACDTVAENGPYGTSIPMTKALAQEVVLAFAMNNEALAPEHGFPLRAVVPGFAGVRSPKWLTGITVQDEASQSHFQQCDYKLLPPDMTPDTVDWAKGIPINEMPLNAAICRPEANTRIPAGPVTIQGYAIATGRSVMRVDVSADGGKHWVQAALEHRPETPWSWTFWQTVIDLGPGEHDLAVRAWDSAGQTQPASPDDTWNFKGYLCAAWHRVPIRIV